MFGFWGMGEHFFYLGNGIRHVLWDMVIGVNVKFGVTTGNIVLLISALLTLAIGAAVFTGVEISLASLSGGQI